MSLSSWDRRQNHGRYDDETRKMRVVNLCGHELYPSVVRLSYYRFIALLRHLISKNRSLGRSPDSVQVANNC